jgi:hypothetical protein
MCFKCVLLVFVFALVLCKQTLPSGDAILSKHLHKIMMTLYKKRSKWTR